MEPTHPPKPIRGHAEYQAMVDRTWTDRGQIPPWHRVIVDRRDVTELPVERWPLADQKRYAEGWRPWLTLPDGSPPRLPTMPEG